MPFQLEKVLSYPKELFTKTESKQEHEQKEFSPEYALKIFFLSFRFSQGNNPLQETIWRYLHTLRPEWRITEEGERFIKDKATSVFEQFLWGKQAAHPPLSRKTLQWPESKGSGLLGDTRPPEPLDLTTYLHKNIDQMKAIFNEQTEVKKSERQDLVHTLAQEMLDRDREFIVQRWKGRPREGMEGKQNAETDPFLSYICHYALETHTTKVQEYDLMFKEIKNVFLTAIKKDKPFLIKGGLIPFTWNLAKLARVYKKHHPESTIDVLLKKFLEQYNK